MAAAAAAAGAGQGKDANAHVKPGGKRKPAASRSTAGPPSKVRKTTARTARTLTDAIAAQRAEHAKLKLAAEAKMAAEHAELGKWFSIQLADTKSDLPDDPEQLRKEIRALSDRPIRDFVSAGKTDENDMSPADLFITELRFAGPLPITPLAQRELITNAIAPFAGVYRGSPRAEFAIRELSLLLRLFVALGGDLNIEVSQYKWHAGDADSLVAIASSSDKALPEGLIKVAKATLGAILVTDIHSLLAVLYAGRKLRMTWCTAHRIDQPGQNLTAIDMAFVVLASNGIQTSFRGGETWKPLQQRLLHVAGEAGMFFDVPGRWPTAVEGPFVWRGDWNCDWVGSRFGEFANDHHSPFLYPEGVFRGHSDGWISAVNHQRRAYRRELPMCIQKSTNLLAVLCPLIALYAAEPLRQVPLTPVTPHLLPQPAQQP
jgi:hypothetical protein